MTPALHGFIAGLVFSGAAVLAGYALSVTVVPAWSKIGRALAGVAQGRAA